MKKAIPAVCASLIALALAMPYVIFKEQIQQMALLGYLGLAVSCALSNASVLLPTSSTIIVLSASFVLDPWLCVLLGGIGTSLGEQVSYWCGRLGRRSFSPEGSDPRTARALRWYTRRPMLAVFFFAFVPLPVFDIIGITAGATKMTWWRFALAAFLGKTLKFLITVFCFDLFMDILRKYYPSTADLPLPIIT